MSSKIEEKVTNVITERFKKKVLPSLKTRVALILIGIAIGSSSILHGMTEAYAWEVAKALISIDGLLIGFSILGITVLSRSGYLETLYKTSTKQSAEELVSHLQDLGKKFKEMTDEEKMEELLFSVVSPFIDVWMLREVFLDSMKFLLVSIGLALFLFGVSTENMNVPYLEHVFTSCYSLAVAAFIIGTYYIVKGISAILEKGEINMEQGFELFKNTFEKKLKDLEKEQAKKK